MSSFDAYKHCCICGVKIDYGNSEDIDDLIYFCGDKEKCSYHINCKQYIPNVKIWTETVEAYNEIDAINRTVVNIMLFVLLGIRVNRVEDQLFEVNYYVMGMSENQSFYEKRRKKFDNLEERIYPLLS